jgi:hypothetical protein
MAGQRPKRELPPLASPVPVLLTWVACWLVFLAVLLLGAGLLITGCAQRGDVDSYAPFKIVFTSTGDDCTNDEYVAAYLDVDNGQQLTCGSGSFSPLLNVAGGIPGFSEAQDNEVFALARQLGEDGLSGADQTRIQQLVNQIDATVPQADRQQPPGYSGFWGTPMAVTGGVVIVLDLVFFRLGRPRLIAVARRRVAARSHKTGHAE